MIWLLIVCGLGAGFLLVRQFPAVPALPDPQKIPSVSIIIPARNEEHNLPALLQSIPPGPQVLVVDDGSVDGTVAVAEAAGATVLSSAALPDGWVGKAWACQQGAEAASGEILIFLDADTRFGPNGYQRVLACALAQTPLTALSVMPFHDCEEPYEELSLFFHLLMAFGAAGFTRLGQPQLLGPSLIVARELYWKAGGHAAVRNQILENLHFANFILQSGGRTLTLNGGSVLSTRMFPSGFQQLYESWSKAFATGAGKTPGAVLGLSILWLTGALLAPVSVLAGGPWIGAVLLYFIFVLQIAWGARQLGAYRWGAILLYPVSLIFYFFVFSRSLWQKLWRDRVTWKGRTI